MNWRTLWLLFLHEMRMLLRSRRTLVTAVLLPLVVMPAMIAGARYTQRQQANQLGTTTFRYAVMGPWAAGAKTLIERYSKAEEFKNFRIQEVDSLDPEQDLQTGSLNFYVRTMNVEEADKAASSARSLSTSRSDEYVPPPVVRGVPALEVVYRANQTISQRGAERMSDMLRAARRNESYTELMSRGFASHPEGILALTAVNLATQSQVAGSNVGRFFTVVLVMWMVAAGSIAAMDIIAGEKERGTLETLMTTAAGRVEIVTAKQLAICVVALAITFIQILNAAAYVEFRLIELPEGFALDLSPTSVLQLFVLFVPLAAALSALLLIVSTYARTYKEAQLHFLPLFLGSLIPALTAVLPGLSSRSLVAVVPLANVSVAAREILMGRPDPLMILVTALVMGLTAALLIRHSASLVVREDIVVSTQHDEAFLAGGQRLFERRVLQWFAVMWAVMFAVGSNVPQLRSVRAQLLFNELVIFLACSLLMVKVYRLRFREVLGELRLPWQVWAAVLMAVPAAQIVTSAFLNIVSTVIPTPSALLQFGEQLAPAPAEIPMWQRYALMAALPAICEELAFRGLLLHGLQKRFHPLVRCVLVGVVFGVFHYTLFRIAPTAFLGVILTMIAMLTGSILPGVLFHAGNNALAIWLESARINTGRLDSAAYIAAFAVFGLAIYGIWSYGRQRGQR
jgi:ABC-type Na+ efflux pump permease subunit/membrane protease YdiL (CAAX protease family)